MTKREICLNNPTIAAYTNSYCGILIKGIEYGIDDYIIFEAHYGNVSYHKAIVHYSNNPYFMFNGKRIHTADCIRV